jgi:hypothetical protein
MSNMRANFAKLRRAERRLEILVPRIFHRVLNRRTPQPGWLPRRYLTVVSADVDLDSGIGAVWLVRRPGSARAETLTARIERHGGRWEYGGAGRGAPGDVEAGRRAAGHPGQSGMIELGGHSGGVSNAYLLEHPHSPASAAPWVEASELRAAAEVSHLLIGERRVEVPAHGRVIVVWKSPLTASGGTRPLITAFGSDGSELSRIGPHDRMDSYSSAKLGATGRTPPAL